MEAATSCPIGSLPPAVLATIIGRVPQDSVADWWLLRSVCRRWRQLFNNPHYARDVRFDGRDAKFTFSVSLLLFATSI